MWHHRHINLSLVEARWNVMAHAQKPDFVFRRNGRVHLNQRGRQFSRLLTAEVRASAVVMLDTPCSEVVWRYWLPTPFASFPFTSPPVRHRVPSHFNWSLPKVHEEHNSEAVCSTEPPLRHFGYTRNARLRPEWLASTNQLFRDINAHCVHSVSCLQGYRNMHTMCRGWVVGLILRIRKKKSYARIAFSNHSVVIHKQHKWH